MASYKVIQDIEAEDKLIGPLTLRQFIYAGVAAVSFYLCFFLSSKGAAYLGVVFLPFGLIFGFFAFPWGKDQPTEVWALARIQFMVKPRKRIWNQSGVKELVTITAPKKVEQRMHSNGLSQNEVRSRLKALADTIDSRGWAIKNVNGGYAAAYSDRLVSASALPQPVSDFSENVGDDMLDMQHNPVAQKFDSMIAASTKAHRQEVIDRMDAVDKPAAAAPLPAPAAPTAPAGPQGGQSAQNNYWFLNQPTQYATDVPSDAVTFNTQVVAPGTTPSNLPVTAAAPTADEEAFIKEHGNQQPYLSRNMRGHLHVVEPLDAQGQPTTPAAATAPQPVNTPMPSPLPPQNTPGPVGGMPLSPGIASIVNAGLPQIGQLPYVDTISNNPAGSDPQAQVTQEPDAAILDLARNDDLNVATLAREAHKRKDASDEVVISLH